MDPNTPGDIDCSSPAHWDGQTLYMFYSTGHPYRSSGPDIFHLSRPSQRVIFNNEAGWNMGGRWIESSHKAGDGKLYMWYHNEPPLATGRTAPRIGTMVSTDNGLNWRDLGIVLEAPDGSNNLQSANKYFVGGNGDFAVIADNKREYLYFFISTYNKDMENSRWYPQVVGIDSAEQQTDKLAGKTARLFVAGVSRWEIVFSAGK
jgi:hypothetical protein